MKTVQGKPNPAQKCVGDVVFGPSFSPRIATLSLLERSATESDSLVRVVMQDVTSSRVLFLGYETGMRELSTSNLKYVLRPIVHKYREGKLKRTHDRE